MSLKFNGNAAHSNEVPGETFWVVQNTSRVGYALMTIVDPWTVRFVGRTADPKRFKSRTGALEFARKRCINFDENCCIPRRVVHCGDFYLIKSQYTDKAPEMMTTDDVIRYC